MGNHELQVLLCETKDEIDAYLAGRPGEGVRSLAEVVAFNQEHADVELAHFGQEYFEMAVQTAGRAEEGYAEARAACLAWAVDTALDPATSAPGGPEILVSPAYPPAWKSDLSLGDHTVGVSGTISAAAMAGWPTLCVPDGPRRRTARRPPARRPAAHRGAAARRRVTWWSRRSTCASELRPTWIAPARG